MSHESMLDFIRSRRSTRKYKADPVPPELLSQVLEAGRYAPSGGNNQSTHLLVIQNPEIRQRLSDMAAESFAAMDPAPDMYRSMRNVVIASQKGIYNQAYHAPVLILTANKSSYSNNIADCSCVLENMMLMANALDLGSCWINHLKWLNEDSKILELLHSCGMAQDERVYGGMALGYPDTEDGLPNRTPLPRTGNPVTYI